MLLQLSCEKSPSTPSTGDQDPPPLTLDSTMPGSSSPPHSPLTQSLQGLHKQPQTKGPAELAAWKNSMVHWQTLNSMTSFGKLTDQTLLVKLLYSLPFLFWKEPAVPLNMQGAPQHPDCQELTDILQDLHVQSQYNMLSVPTLSNRIVHLHYHMGLAATLAPLPISSEGIKLALTLISAIYPSIYGWN